MANMVFKSSVAWTGSGVACDAQSGKHSIRIDEPPVLGGADSGPNPVELLLSALGGCMVVLLNAFAPAHQVSISKLSVAVEGDLDPDGFMDRAAVRPGFSAIRYRVDIESPSPQEAIDALIAHAERACPVKDTLQGVPIERV